MIETTTLNNGMEVLAKKYKEYGLCPMTYANRTQAYNALAKLGAGWYVWQGTGRPFFVVKRPA